MPVRIPVELDVDSSPGEFLAAGKEAGSSYSAGFDSRTGDLDAAALAGLGDGGAFSRRGQDSGVGFGDGIRRGLGSSIGGIISDFGTAFQGGIVGNPAIIGGVAAAIGAAMPLAGTLAAGSFVTAFGAGIAGLGLVFAAQNEQVKSTFKTLGSDIAATMRDISKPLQGTLLTTAAVARKTFQTFAPELESAFASMAPVLSGFIGQLGSAFEQLAPSIGPMTDTFNEILKELGPELVPLFQDISDALIDLSDAIDPKTFAEMLAGILQIIPGIINFITWLTNAQNAIQPWYTSIVQAVSGIGSAFGELWAIIGPIVGPTLVILFQGVATGVSIAAGIIAGAIRIAASAFQAFGQGFQATVAFLRPLMASIGQIAVQVFSVISGVITSAVNVSHRVVTVAFNAIRTVIQTVMRVVAAVVRTGVNAVRGAWNGLKALAGITRSVFNAVRNAVTSVLRAITGVVRSGVNGARNAMVSGWNAVRNATVTAWNAVKNAVTNGINAVVNAVSGLKGKVTGALSGAGSWLKDAGKKIMQGLIDGIESMMSSVTSKLSKLTKLIPKVKGPPAKDKKLLYGAGRFIMQGLIAGVDKETTPFLDRLRALTSDAISTTENGFGIASPSKVFKGIGKNIVDGFISGMDDNKNKAKKAAERLSDAVTNAVKKKRIGKKAGIEMQVAISRVLAVATDARELSKSLGFLGGGLAQVFDSQFTRFLQSGNFGKKGIKAFRKQIEILTKDMSKAVKTLGERNNFAKELSGSLLGEFELGGGDITSITEAATGIATRLKAFAGKLGNLAKAGIPPILISEVANMGSSKGSAVADALLNSSKAQRDDLRAAYKDLQKFSARAAGAAATGVFGSKEFIRNAPSKRLGKGTVSRPVDTFGNRQVTNEINNNFYGPTTSGGRLREIDWTLRYATNGTRESVAGVPA